MPATWLRTFRIRCACVLLCAGASAGAAQAQVLRGRWEGDSLTPLSLDFRGGDTVWQLIPIAVISANGRGTYEYANGRLIEHYGEGPSVSMTANLRGDTLLLTANGQTETDTRVAAVRGARSPLHGTRVTPEGDQLRLVTYLPGGVFFQEAAIIAHYTVDRGTVTMRTGGSSVQWQIKTLGADTVLARLDGNVTFHRPKCDDRRLDPQRTFNSNCT
jgi:hypothetical protein